nr:unnamed protein product [Spirometra erinaceieuropaei]
MVIFNDNDTRINPSHCQLKEAGRKPPPPPPPPLPGSGEGIPSPECGPGGGGGAGGAGGGGALGVEDTDGSGGRVDDGGARAVFGDIYSCWETDE